MDVPGVHPEDLSAEVVDGQLIVTGERAPAEGAARRYRSERWQGRFVRSFSAATTGVWRIRWGTSRAEDEIYPTTPEDVTSTA